MKWDLYPVADPKAPCFVHIHGGYWQRGSKEIFACLAEGALANGWSAALPGYTLAPEASLTQITTELRSAFDWLNAKGAEHGIAGPVIVTGWSAGGHLTAFLLDHPRVVAGLSISGVFELAPLRDSPQVNDKVKLTEVEIETLSPMRRPSVNKPLSIAYGTSELPAMVATSRDYHAYRSESHLPGDLIPIAKANHFTILDELRLPDSHLTREVLQLSTYKVTWLSGSDASHRVRRQAELAAPALIDTWTTPHERRMHLGQFHYLPPRQLCRKWQRNSSSPKNDAWEDGNYCRG
jgi:arylformamidase